MVRVAVVVAHDVEAGGVRLALDADVIARIDLVPVSCAVDDDVARALDLGDLAVAPGSDHDAADLVRVALGSVRTNRRARRRSSGSKRRAPSTGATCPRTCPSCRDPRRSA